MAGASSFQETYLQSILDKVAREKGFIQPRYSISPGSKPGDNFNCSIFRVVITESSEGKNVKSLSLIFKAPPLSKTNTEKLKRLSRVEKEVYETVLPTLNKLLNKFGVVKSDIFPNTVRCFVTDVENPLCDILVLEDKFPDGYTLISDRKNLDEEHCHHILKNLALWHSSSIALIHHEPETAERLQKLITGTKDEIFNNNDHRILNECLRTSYRMDDRVKQDKDLREKLRALIRNLPQEIAKANQIPTDLCCIIKGDCWFNNILFKYNTDGSLQNICLIDHQMTRFASPAVELLYMMFTCTTKNVRDAAYENLIRFYHGEVCSLLRKMKCDPEKMFSWEMLQEHLTRYAATPVLIVFCGFQMVLDSSVSGIDSHSSEEENNGSPSAEGVKDSNSKKSEEISKKITYIIVEAARLGYL